MARWATGLTILVLGFLPAAAGAGARDASRSAADSRTDLPIERWLVAGPTAERLPLFDERKPKEVSAALLDEPVLPGEDLWPQSGNALEWRAGESLLWREQQAPSGEIVPGPAGGGTHLALLACYLESPRWQRVDLVLASRNVLGVWLDGTEATRKNAATAAAGEEPETVASLVLHTGKSRLLVRTAISPGDSLPDWRIRAALRIPMERVADAPTISLSPKRTFARLEDLSRIEGAGTAVLSPDGKRFAVGRSRWVPETDKTDQLLEIRAAEDGRLIHTLDLRAAVSSPAWSPDGSRLGVIVAGDGGKSDLWVLDLEDGSFVKVLEGKTSLSEFVWSAGGKDIVFVAAPKEGKTEEPKYERLTEPYMRWPGWKERGQLWMVSLSDRVERPLALGEFAIDRLAACPDRPLAAFVRTVPIEVRPYERMDLWTLNLETLEATLERELRFAVLGEMAFGPGGKRIAWVASPAETDTLPSSVDHNAYEQDLWVWDRAERTMANLTDGFDPSVGADLYGTGSGRRIWWNPSDGRIYFTATDRGTNPLYRADVKKREISRLPLEPTAVYGVSGSGPGDCLLLWGCSIDVPARLYRYDLDRRRLREVLYPGNPVWSEIGFGKAEPWDFVNSRNQTIEGWIYLPPGFDPAGTYPMIVYYYGGVFPNGEAFNWRNHYLAANGYVVYTLNPAGAAGYGPEFADEHVNDWGNLAAEDVIEGVENLLAEKTFVDPKRVGAFGGSYGGFLTMQILTKTDLFAAAEASYGISNITSYWGEGRWGYLYGDVAMARSYPWNRPDIFVERSPLFHADRIHTPLLLTHGTGDTNVPSGESDQMFTALRVLRRDVVYVRFPGQEHGIVGTQSIRVAHNEIRLEWFDKYLKDQPEAWEERWKDEKQTTDNGQ